MLGLQIIACIANFVLFVLPKYGKYEMYEVRNSYFVLNSYYEFVHEFVLSEYEFVLS